MSDPTNLKPLLALLSACNFVIGMGAFMVIGLITPMAEGLEISTAAAGATLSVYALSYAVFSPVLVSLTGRIGRRRVLTTGMALFSLGTLLTLLATSAAMVYGARALTAVGAGMFTPVSAAVVALLVPPERQGRALAAVFFGLTFAQVLGVPAGSWIAYTFGWRIAFWLVFGMASIAALLLWIRVPAGLRFQPATLSDLGQVLTNRLLMGAILFTTTFLSAIYVLYTFLAPLLSQDMGYGRDGITLMLIVFGCGAVVGNLAGGWLNDRVGPIKALVCLCLGQILLMPMFSALPMPDITLFILVFIWSTFGWSFMPAQQVRLLSLAPNMAGVVLSLNAAAIYVGAATGSALGGALQTRIGLGGLGAAAGILAVGALGHILWSHRAANLSR